MDWNNVDNRERRIEALNSILQNGQAIHLVVPELGIHWRDLSRELLGADLGWGKNHELISTVISCRDSVDLSETKGSFPIIVECSIFDKSNRRNTIEILSGQPGDFAFTVDSQGNLLSFRVQTQALAQVSESDGGSFVIPDLEGERLEFMHPLNPLDLQSRGAAIADKTLTQLQLRGRCEPTTEQKLGR